MNPFGNFVKILSEKYDMIRYDELYLYAPKI